MKKIALIGSTGSIGRQVIDVVSRNGDRFKLVALVAGSSYKLLEEQVTKMKPAFAALCDVAAAKNFSAEGVTFLSGDDGALKALEECGADTAVVACGGFAGLKYSLKAIELGMSLALANKETLVCGGELVMPRVKSLAPIDSEHSALWQCLNFKRDAEFERLVITASGGAFRGRSWQSLSSVTAEEALNHPTWKMGAKITIDSATMLNKGYEVIEAHYLYNAPYTKITAVIHPQSIVHSMVQFKDGATLAQLSYPTMELPIQLALTYPERLALPLSQLDFTEAFKLEFQPLIRAEYPMYDIALFCGVEGGVLPTALNAASEIAVRAFLEGRIKYTDIYTVAAKVVSATANERAESLEQLTAVDEKSRRAATRFAEEL